MQYLRARYYNSGTGSFITEDTELGSIEKPITRNLYIYCGNNPLNYTDPSGHNWFKNAVNSVKRTASNVVNTVKSGYNTAKNWANTHIVQPVKSFVSNTKTAVTNAYSKGKTYVTQKCNQVKQSYNNAKNWVNNKAQQFYNDYVPPKVQKAIEEAKKFVCTTTDRIVKDTKEFIQNVDWKKVAIGVAATVAVTAVVVATGGAAAPVLIGAAVGAGASTGITVVSGAIQGKTPAEIAKDASDAFMWGAIGGAFSGGTTSLIKSAGQSAAKSFVKSNLIEGGVDTAVDLAQTATQNGGLTPQAVLTSVVINVGGAFIGAPDTPSTTRNQIVDGVTDKNTLKKALKEESTIRVDSYKNMKNDPNITGQAHHLSQDAAFRDVIPKNEGLTVELNGNAFSEKGSGHYEAHKSLEEFWDNYRNGGDLYGSKPSVGEYNSALYKSLQEAGLSDADAAYAVREAYGQQMQYGLKNNSEVPRIPGRINQKK